MPTDDAFRARLARLRREVAGPPQGLEVAPPHSPNATQADSLSASPLPAWFLSRSSAQARALASGAGADNSHANLGDPQELQLKLGPNGPYTVRECVLPIAHTHGSYQLHEALDAQPQAFEHLTRKRTRNFPGAREAVFFDIETTGLAGGAGTQVFLIGLGWFEDETFVLWQGFLREPAEEAALLAAVDERIRCKQALVSFFGKSFDRHRIEDRMRMQRMDAPFDGRTHLDLYYASRNAYAGAFPNLRLATLERELTGLSRQADLSGAFAPAAWMDYLAGRPHRLEGVLQHNRDDVLSLVTLYAHLGRVFLNVRADGRVLEPRGEVGARRAVNLAQVRGSSG